MKNKARINYIVDLVIAAGFVLSAVSGLVMYFAGSGGYQGGRNAAYGLLVLGLDRHAWGDLHTWSSVVMIAGVSAHLILHWNWMVCMTRNLFKRRTAATAAEVCAVECAR